MSLETKKSVAHAEIFESEREHLKKKISDCNDQLTKLTNKLIVYRRENNRIQIVVRIIGFKMSFYLIIIEINQIIMKRFKLAKES
ncbi:hypothetical protein [Legionella sainthelensi]|uniref:hypothetical protein n=1 Tax=Legionella sainthelensi TaxID=28087 RepID=UPI0021660290|nr:hypothetical protein [Legionella sainthelensi]